MYLGKKIPSGVARHHGNCSALSVGHTTQAADTTICKLALTINFRPFFFTFQTSSLARQQPIKRDIHVQRFWLRPVRKKIASHTWSVLIGFASPNPALEMWNKRLTVNASLQMVVQPSPVEQQRRLPRGAHSLPPDRTRLYPQATHGAALRAAFTSCNVTRNVLSPPYFAIWAGHC